jgi:hypothetical protein
VGKRNTAIDHTIICDSVESAVFLSMTCVFSLIIWMPAQVEIDERRVFFFSSSGSSSSRNGWFRMYCKSRDMSIRLVVSMSSTCTHTSSSTPCS